LDEYCVFCGLIGHKKSVCPAPQKLDPLEKYNISLKPTTSNGPHLVAMVPSEDSDSGLSSAASMGNSHCNIEPSHATASSNKNHAQMVPHVQSKNALLLSKEVSYQALIIPHMDSSSMVPDFSAFSTVPTQQGKLLYLVFVLQDILSCSSYLSTKRQR
jgi:hypothetical protein